MCVRGLNFALSDAIKFVVLKFPPSSSPWRCFDSKQAPRDHGGDPRHPQQQRCTAGRCAEPPHPPGARAPRGLFLRRAARGAARRAARRGLALPRDAPAHALLLGHARRLPRAARALWRHRGRAARQAQAALAREPRRNGAPRGLRRAAARARAAEQRRGRGAHRAGHLRGARGGARRARRARAAPARRAPLTSAPLIPSPCVVRRASWTSASSACT